MSHTPRLVRPPAGPPGLHRTRTPSWEGNRGGGGSGAGSGDHGGRVGEPVPWYSHQGGASTSLSGTRDTSGSTTLLRVMRRTGSGGASLPLLPVPSLPRALRRKQSMPVLGRRGGAAEEGKAATAAVTSWISPSDDSHVAAQLPPQMPRALRRKGTAPALGRSRASEDWKAGNSSADQWLAEEREGGGGGGSSHHSPAHPSASSPHKASSPLGRLRVLQLRVDARGDGGGMGVGGAGGGLESNSPSRLSRTGGIYALPHARKMPLLIPRREGHLLEMDSPCSSAAASPYDRLASPFSRLASPYGVTEYGGGGRAAIQRDP